MRQRLLIYILAIGIGLLIAVAYVNGAEKVEKLYKTHTLGPADVAISCVDGGKPIVQEVATDKRIIIVSCPGEAEERAPRGSSR